MKINLRKAYAFGRLTVTSKAESMSMSRHPLSVYKRMRDAGATITPYDTPERWVVGRKIVNIEYHKIDWSANFYANRKAVTQ